MSGGTGGATLAEPARYWPLAKGVYEVAAGLRPLGADFGNGELDRVVFQVDRAWPRFRAGKLACRADRVGKYVARAGLDEPAAAALVEWMADRLTTDWPAWFSRAGGELQCRLSGETVTLDGEPFGVFDQLAMQVAEDVCLVRADGGRDWLAAAHVCSPGHWSAERKAGLAFTAVHEPVPGMAAINRAAGAFVRRMVEGGPMVRFAWGFGTDDRLNHHPDPPAGVDPVAWRGRQFEAGGSALYVRVERQVTWGLPAVGAAVFTIRVSHWDGAAIRADPLKRALLRAAVAGLSDAAAAYKGVGESRAAVLAWLDEQR